MAYCGNCGSVIADDAKFCENCGAPHMQAVAQAAQAEPEQQNSNSSSQQAQPQETYSSYSYGGGQQSQTQQSYSYSAGQQEGSSYGTGAAYGSASAGNIGGPTPGVGFVEAVQTCFSKYATFEGRARRSEYWYFMLFSWIVAAFMLMQMAVCQAGGNIPKEDVAIGGIPLNVSEEYVRSVYGAPDDISYKTDGGFGKTKKGLF